MNKKLICLLAVVGCATLISGCSNEQKQLPAEMVMSKHAMMNGTADNATAHKAVIGLYQKNASSSCGDDMLFCTGTLIHPQWVLTAAHCVTETSSYSNKVSPSSCNKYLKIGVGNSESEVKKNLYDIAGTSYIYYHNNYGDRYLSSSSWSDDSKYGTIDADIALIKLKNPIPESVAKPILPHPEWLKINSKSLATDMVFSGFGYNEKGSIGNKLTFTGSVTKYCGPANSGDATTGCKAGSVTYSGCHPAPDYCSYYGYSYNETEYVLMPYGSIYYDQKKGGPCQGDSGGPAFYTVGGVEYVSGITSYGDGICAAYGISTAVQDYYDWILSKAPEVADQYVEICDNGVDDDGNGKVDSADEACGSKEPVCGDGVVNGNEECDGTAFLNGVKKCAKIDNKYDSGNVYCNADCTINYSACSLAATAEVCNDGIDNDKDGSTDCNDIDCKYDAACYVAPVATAEICNDGIDNDLDGSTDCNDIDCKYDAACAVAEPDVPVVDDPVEVDPVDDPDDIGGNNDNNDDIPWYQEEVVTGSYCGDGVLDDDEECDGSAFLFGEDRCHEWITVFTSGVITCNADCTINFSGCQLNYGSSAAHAENCSNGIDDDLNGLIDCADPACLASTFCNKPAVEICNNGIDDDGDGKVDCEDTACANKGYCFQRGKENCSNGIDDDLNGLADCEDPACITATNCISKIPENCNNNADDDRDGKVDCEDSDCASSVYCNTSAPVEICNNNIDDDGDGTVDCLDFDCRNDYSCKLLGDGICSNHIDDDGNGLIDCDDPICSDLLECGAKAQKKDDFNCQANTKLPSNGSPLALLFGLLGLGFIVRRRREH